MVKCRYSSQIISILKNLNSKVYANTSIRGYICPIGKNTQTLLAVENILNLLKTTYLECNNKYSDPAARRLRRGVSDFIDRENSDV